MFETPSVSRTGFFVFHSPSLFAQITEKKNQSVIVLHHHHVSSLSLIAKWIEKHWKEIKFLLFSHFLKSIYFFIFYIDNITLCCTRLLCCQGQNGRRFFCFLLFFGRWLDQPPDGTRSGNWERARKKSPWDVLSQFVNCCKKEKCVTNPHFRHCILYT
jgi:hypothetical protein